MATAYKSFRYKANVAWSSARRGTLSASGKPNVDVGSPPEFKGAPDWFADGARTKASGLADVPLTYDPPVTEAAPLKFVREDQPEKPDLARCWAQEEPARKLVNLQNTPILIVTSEASYHASYDHCTVRYLAQAGVKSTFIRLADVGIHGNGHMMMLEKNSDAIAKVMADWLDRTLPGAAPKRARSASAQPTTHAH